MGSKVLNLVDLGPESVKLSSFRAHSKVLSVFDFGSKVLTLVKLGFESVAVSQCWIRPCLI